MYQFYGHREQIMSEIDPNYTMVLFYVEKPSVSALRMTSNLY
jgi:hypothetical protein